jgi:hypothetical protein
MRKFFVNPESLRFYAILAEYLDVLRNFLNTHKLDQEGWKKVEAQCLRVTASRYDAQLTLAKLRCLKGMDAGDSELLNRGITTLVEDHENEAKRGENQRSTRGFICFPGLMFAYLGADLKMVCTVQSPYLPLRLLDN